MNVFLLFYSQTMKKNLLLLLSFALFHCAQAQDAAFSSIPDAQVKGLDGKKMQTADLSNNGKPMVISMWATWCKPCIRELNAISDMYIDWQDETGVKLIAISIDDSRNATKVGPFVNGAGWEYEVYIDENQDFKRLLNVNTIPHTFLVNGKGEIVWQHNGYTAGDEDELYELIKKVAAGEPLSSAPH